MGFQLSWNEGSAPLPKVVVSPMASHPGLLTRVKARPFVLSPFDKLPTLCYISHRNLYPLGFGRMVKRSKGIYLSGGFLSMAVDYLTWRELHPLTA